MHQSQVLCLDGDYVDRGRLKVDANEFLACDLEESIPAEASGWGADLTVCLEVAEHLSAERGPGLIHDLGQSAPVVAFSAAFPGQGGQGHINERPHEYWEELWDAEGFTVDASIRDELEPEVDVAPWYAVNILIATRRP